MIPRLLLLLLVGYLGGLLSITTLPLFLDGNTASLVTIGPLIFDVILTAYLGVHYLHLRGIFKLGAYVLAYFGMVAMWSGIIAPVGTGNALPANVNNNIDQFTNSTVRWVNNFRNNCVLVHGQSSDPQSTLYFGLGYGSATAQLATDCHGLSQLSVETYSSGVSSSEHMQSSVWFQDQPFYVPDNGQNTTRVIIGGEVWIEGWLTRQSSGLGIYQSDASLWITLRLTGDAPCDTYQCYDAYTTMYWSAPRTLFETYDLPQLVAYVPAGHTYAATVSFNVTSYATGTGAGGIATGTACFGHSSYCTSTPESATGPPMTCLQHPTAFQPCEVDVTALTYSVTDY